MKLFYFILFFIFTGIIISYINYNNFKSNNIYLIIYISLLFGFILAYFVNYKKNKKNKKNLQELVLFINNNCYHIHHYITYSLFILFILLGRFVKNNYIIYFIIFFMIGLSIEDLLFDDWYIIKNNCNKNKLIKLLLKLS